jgi:hypothetical protein
MKKKMLPKGLQKKSLVNNAVYNNPENRERKTELRDQELDNKLLKLGEKKLLRDLI